MHNTKAFLSALLGLAAGSSAFPVVRLSEYRQPPCRRKGRPGKHRLVDVGSGYPGVKLIRKAANGRLTLRHG